MSQGQSLKAKVSRPKSQSQSLKVTASTLKVKDWTLGAKVIDPEAQAKALRIEQKWTLHSTSDSLTG